MGNQNNTLIVRRFYQEILGAGGRGDDILADDYRAYGLGPEPLGKEATLQLAGLFHDSLQGMTIDIKEQLEENGLVASQYVISGTHQGGFPPGIPATGRPIALPGVALHRVRDGKIVEDWPGFDQFLMLIQLGVISMPDSADTPVPESRSPAGSATMSRDEVAGWLTTFYQRALSDGDLGLMDEMLAQDYIDTSPTYPPGMPRDRDGLKQLISVYRAAFTGWKVTIEEMLIEGDSAVLRCTWSGRHTGAMPGLDVPPTGREVQYGSVELCRLRNGKGIEHYGIFDQVSMLQQLGAIPVPEAGGTQR